jgi:hypothetical protein
MDVSILRNSAITVGAKTYNCVTVIYYGILYFGAQMVRSLMNVSTTQTYGENVTSYNLSRFLPHLTSMVAG